MTDIEIAQAHEMKKIVDVAAKAGIDEKHLELYGNYKAKLDLSEIRKLPRKAKLILVTAISPTPAGEGKTTTSATSSTASAARPAACPARTALRSPSRAKSWQFSALRPASPTSRSASARWSSPTPTTTSPSPRTT